MRKGAQAVVFSLLFMGLISGCSRGNSESYFSSEVSPSPASLESPTIQIGVSEESLTFTLTTDDTPEFGEIDFDESGGMYVERDGYAYRLDPATLDVIDVPLDPVTKEPVDLNISVDPVPEDSADVSSSATTNSATRVPPTDANKYPSTGLLLEEAD